VYEQPAYGNASGVGLKLAVHSLGSMYNVESRNSPAPRKEYNQPEESAESVLATFSKGSWCGSGYSVYWGAQHDAVRFPCSVGKTASQVNCGSGISIPVGQVLSD
jgi:hypothetical protein